MSYEQFLLDSITALEKRIIVLEKHILKELKEIDNSKELKDLAAKLAESTNELNKVIENNQ